MRRNVNKEENPLPFLMLLLLTFLGIYRTVQTAVRQGNDFPSVDETFNITVNTENNEGCTADDLIVDPVAAVLEITSDNCNGKVAINLAKACREDVERAAKNAIQAWFLPSTSQCVRGTKFTQNNNNHFTAVVTHSAGPNCQPPVPARLGMPKFCQ